MRHLASVAMGKIISKGDNISIYSRVSSLQGFLSDGKRSEPQKVAGWFTISHYLVGYLQIHTSVGNRALIVLLALFATAIDLKIHAYFFCINNGSSNFKFMLSEFDNRLKP